MMPAQSPEEVDVLFAKALNAGDVDGMVSMYEPNASFVGQGGEVAVGHDAIRAAIKTYIDLKPEIDLKVEKTVATGTDLAVCYGVWTMSIGGQEMTGKSMEIVRKQPDGTWLFAIDDPWGRGT
jgi:uncharacterized protein (TIGR02246 family)